jgi:osmotically-inducible protein OsmY
MRTEATQAQNRLNPRKEHDMKVLTLAMAALAFTLAGCASDPNSSAPASSGASGESEIKRDSKNAMLTGKVKAALAADVGLKTWNIDVDSAGTTVTLNGMVDSEATKQRAESVARGVNGVATVKNNLKVKGSS